MHIVYNRVNNDGNAISGDQNFRQSARITQKLTLEYGLTFGKGKKKVNRDRLKGRDAIKYRIHDAINEALKDCRSMEALRAALATRDIGMNIIHNTDGKAKGVVFTCESLSFAGYQIDRPLYALINYPQGTGDYRKHRHSHFGRPGGAARLCF